MVEVRSRAERKEATRRRLLDATLALISNRSLATISLREVARDAGIVPTAFYRHFESMDALGVELVDESMRPLRQVLRDARQGVADHGDIIRGSVDVLADRVRGNAEEFRFLVRERYGGVRGVRRAIEHELTLFTTELTVDLARMTVGYGWSAEDLEMTADLMVAAMLKTIIDLLELESTASRRTDDEAHILDRAERQLRLVALGMSAWRTPG